MITLSLALSILRRHDLEFADFYLACPAAVALCDCTVNREALARWVGIAH